MKSNKQVKKFIGKLVLGEKSLNEMNYGVITKTEHGITYSSITDLLDKIYKSDNPDVHITIKYYNEDGNLHKIDKSGELLRDKDKYNVYGYFVNQYPLELELFNLVDNEITMFIEYDDKIMEEKTDNAN